MHFNGDLRTILKLSMDGATRPIRTSNDVDIRSIIYFRIDIDTARRASI